MGILYAYTQHSYLIFGLLGVFFLSPRWNFIFFFTVGLFFAAGHQWWIKPSGMPDDLILSDAIIQGHVASIPNLDKQHAAFTFALDRINGQKAQALIQLTWYTPYHIVHAGEEWQLGVKIKRPRNFLNPGSYDYVRALQTKHIFWTGYVRNQNNHRIQKASSSNWLFFREHLIQRLNQIAPTPKIAGIIQALTLNHTQQISQEAWSLFRRTGTTHLFGISGEHIALLSGLFFFIIRRLWSQSASLCLLLPAQTLASIGSVLVALAYALLAGFAPPVQRALIGCFLYALSYLSLQRFTPWQVWRYALVGVLVLEPHAVFMQGFYFSFLAVVCLLLTQQRWRLKGYQGNLALQVSCLLGLMPFSLYWFSYGSINGFIANLFAIPLVGLLIVPLSLTLLTCAAWHWVWIIEKPLTALINLLFLGLEWSEHLANMNIQYTVNSITSLIFLIAGLLTWVLLPIKPFRFIALLWLILPFFPATQTPKLGEALIQVLDVGQGLSVSIQTQHHTLLYDTGDQFFNGTDLGTMVIVPFYQQIRVNQLDSIIISHPDKDHLGGLRSVEAAFPVHQLIVNDPKHYHRGANCHHYPQWEWDKVQFRFFPIQAPFKNKNNQSCILQISTGGGRFLLTGDIEKKAEDYLVQHYGGALQSQVVLIPHHGSKTSSSYRFLLEVAPQFTIASLGFDNRFHFPHQKTLNTLNRLTIPFYRTDECGMIEVRLPSAGQLLSAPTCSGQIA